MSQIDWYGAGFCIQVQQGEDAVMDKAEIYERCREGFDRRAYMQGAVDAGFNPIISNLSEAELQDPLRSAPESPIPHESAPNKVKDLKLAA